LDSFFGEFDLVIDSIKEIHKWHPSFLVGNKKQKAGKGKAFQAKGKAVQKAWSCAASY